MKSIPTPSNIARVLAFDPGFERLGVAVVEKQSGKEILIHSDCIQTSATLSFPERLNILSEAVESCIETHAPEAVALESLFFTNNQKTAMRVAEVRGMLLHLAAARGLPIFQYTPQQVKIAVTGYGKSDKAAVSAMIPRLIKLSARKRLDDEMDAIAVALTCLAHTRT